MRRGIRRLVMDEDIIPVQTFIAYGEWFQQQLVPELERVRVVSVDRRGSEGFELKLDSGVVHGAGGRRGHGTVRLAHPPPSSAARRRTNPHPPAPSRTAPSTTIRPVLRQGTDLGCRRGRVRAGDGARGGGGRAGAGGVPGTGQGRLRDHRRSSRRLRSESPFGRAWSLWALSYYPHPYRYLPAEARHYLVRLVLGPLGAWWLRDRFEGKVEAQRGLRDRSRRRLRRASGPPRCRPWAAGQRGQLAADHVIAATGHRVDIAMDFLGHELRTALAVSRGTPKLGAGYAAFGWWHFTTARLLYGPVMRFVRHGFALRLAKHLASAHGRGDGARSVGGGR